MRKTMMTFCTVAMVGLSGCASMSADECASSDWAAIGYEDGSRGFTSDQFAHHRKACAKHGITANFSAYQSGRNDGLVEFCQPGRGFSHGANGGHYRGVCAADMEADYLDAYRAGQRLHALRSTVAAIDSQIYSNEQELANIAGTVGSKQALLIARETSVEDRILLLADLKHLSERSGELESDIEVLLGERSRAELELQNYEQTVASLGF